MLLLIDTREPLFPPEPDPTPRRRFRLGQLRALRPLLPLAVGLLLLVVSGAFPPVAAYVVILAACVFIGRGLCSFIRSTPGLKDHRQ
jgi:hypothetical protein